MLFSIKFNQFLRNAYRTPLYLKLTIKNRYTLQVVSQSVFNTMWFIILILCLFTFQVDASDWSSRTIRVDLNTNRTAFDRQNGLFEQAARSLNGVNATNGQYPWSIMTTAWSGNGAGSWIGITCSSSIISENFALTDLHCTGRK